MNKHILEFNSWVSSEFENINEGVTYDKTINWLSKNFGGRVAKLDSILANIKKLENEYINEWEDIITDIDALEIEKEQTKSDPAERKKLDRIIIRKNRVLETLTKKHSNDLKELKNKGESIVEKVDRLKAYWDLELANLESDLAEDMYKKSKELSTSVASDELYNKYRAAMENAKKKDSIFRDKYGALISFKFNKGSNSESTMDKLIYMENDNFESSIKTMDTSALKKLIRYIKKVRNEQYATLDKEKEFLEKSLKASPGEEAKISEKIKEVSKTHMEIIRSLRTKITIVNRYV